MTRFPERVRGPHSRSGKGSRLAPFGLLQVRNVLAQQQHFESSRLAGNPGEVAVAFGLKDHSMGGWTPNSKEVGDFVLRGRASMYLRVAVDVSQVVSLHPGERLSHGLPVGRE